MDQKSISKKITYVILAILLLEVLVFAGWYFTEPTYKATVLSIVKDHESPDQSYFYTSTTNQNFSIDAIYNALSIYSSLNQSMPNKNVITSSILGSYNFSTGLFSKNNVSSLETTFQAVSALSILGQVNKINKTKTIDSILALRTTDSLFREYNEFNDSNQILVGELDHLYQGLASLRILYQNNTKLFSDINSTKMIKSIFSLQSGDGGFLEGILYNTSNMKNAYYLTKIFSLLNNPLSYYESLGFRASDLEQWIQSMYTNKGFKMQGTSEPSVEATAYALITLRFLEASTQSIKANYSDGVNSIMNFLSTNFLNDPTRNSLDVLNDILSALSQINQLTTLNKTYFSLTAQFYFGSMFTITILAFVINILINLFFALKEDDNKYFEGKLHIVIQKIIEGNDQDLLELSSLLGETINTIEIIPIENDEKLALLKASANNVFFLISYETFNGLAKKIEKYSNQDDLLSVIDFLESDIFFTIDQGRSHLVENKISD